MNDVAEANESLPRQLVVTNKWSQLHSELVRMMMMKDFINFKSVGKGYVSNMTILPLVTL